ncbi:MAG TPA: M20 family metallopeptidase [Anaerolineaceae bacterium]|nr:M20 family metallopeptidase [Anaerolineaceae bacterium]HQH87031.1 M20 family metallopeptidase [Anaerolineaceae bacterium]
MIRNDLNEFLIKKQQELIQIRRSLHMFPELSNKEHNTINLISSQLRSEGITQFSIYSSSLVVTFGPNHDSAIAFRADIDALPIEEESNHEYISQNSGIMHACGHDVHSTILLGLAFYLHKIENILKKPVKLIFQQSEEVIPSGAEMLVQHGVLQDPKVEQIYGFHVWPKLSIGEVGVKPRNVMGGLDGIKITITSKDPPDESGVLGGIDGIRIAAYFLSLAGNLMHGRRLTEEQPFTLSFGIINGGVRPNYFTRSVSIEGVIRFLDQESREMVKEKINKIILDVKNKYNAEIVLEILADIRPILVNSDNCVDVLCRSLNPLTDIRVLMLDTPLHASEDFGWYLQKTKGAYILLGSKSNNATGHMLHTPLFNVDERVINLGVLALAKIAIDEAI